jgi:low temperature requirement protein LtrA
VTANGGPIEPERRSVSTLELFFDLVFVFAITQLTAILAGDPSLVTVLRVLLLFGVLWWMFGGYVWLTNAVAPDRPIRKLLLLAAMVGFLVMALAIPTAFTGGGVVFGIGYLAVVLIHAGLFVSSQRGLGVAGIFRVAPLNIIGALIILGAGFLSAPIVYVAWAVAFGLEVLTSFLASPEGFSIEPSHFVERHGLLLIIVLGESIVAISVGAAGLALDASLLVAGGLALVIASCLWWLYFNEDDTHAEEAMIAASPQVRMRIALNAFFYAQIPMILGVVGFAAGVKSAIEHAFEPLPAYAALALGLGVGLYLLGDVLLRLSIGWGHAWVRSLAAVAAVATLSIGMATSSVAQLAALFVVLLIAILAPEGASRPHQAGTIRT